MPSMSKTMHSSSPGFAARAAAYRLASERLKSPPKGVGSRMAIDDTVKGRSARRRSIADRSRIARCSVNLATRSGPPTSTPSAPPDSFAVSGDQTDRYPIISKRIDATMCSSSAVSAWLAPACVSASMTSRFGPTSTTQIRTVSPTSIPVQAEPGLAVCHR